MEISYPSPVIRALVFGFVFLLCIPNLAVSQNAPILTATYEGIINPVAAEYLHDAIRHAEERHAQLLVFQLDTPGGLDTSMRAMIKDMTGSPIPIAVFVSPTGGRAASAGVFLTLAAHIAAMAPGTNIGAAHPVAMGGKEMDDVMKEKVENDAVAYIQSIAERRGRDITWAENAVRKSVSAPATEAKQLGLVDLIAEDLEDLLQQLDEWTVRMGTRTVMLHTKNADRESFPMNWRLEVLQVISNPNIAYVLMTIGTIGLIAELYNPGAILPGVVGGISLILAFYSLQSLPVNYAGVLLFLLGIVMFILEVTVASFGVLAIGGVTAMILGSLMLMNQDFPYYQISLSVIFPMVGLALGFTFFVAKFGMNALRRVPSTGSEGMTGLVGLAHTNLSPDGKIFVHGELWDAISSAPVSAGQAIEVIKIEGLTLHVKPVLPEREEH